MFFWWRNFKHFFITLFVTSIYFIVVRYIYFSIVLRYKGDINETLIVFLSTFILGVLTVIGGLSLLEIINEERKVFESIKFAFRISFDYIGEIIFSILVSGVVLIILYTLSLFLFITAVGIVIVPFLSFFVTNWVYLYYVNLYIYIKQKEELKKKK